MLLPCVCLTRCRWSAVGRTPGGPDKRDITDRAEMGRRVRLAAEAAAIVMRAVLMVALSFTDRL